MSLTPDVGPRPEPDPPLPPRPLPLHQRIDGFARRKLARLAKRLRPAGARRAIKRRLPRSLLGRSLLIIVLPIVVMQTAVGWVFFDAQWRTVTHQLSEAVAGDVAWDVDAFQAAPTPANAQAIAERAEKVQSLSVAFQPGRAIPKGRRASVFPTFDDTLRAEVDDKLEEDFWLDSTRYPAYIDIRVQVRGGVLRFLVPRERAFSTKGPLFIFWLTVVTLLLTTVAILFIRNQVRAIERLAEAADAFGRGVEPVNFKPHGAAEVRMAAVAFIDMKDRIKAHIDQRTTLLAAVSHDLRTPLTRLKLEAAMAEPGPRIDGIKRDLADMEHMIDEYLAFARGEEGEGAQPTLVGLVVAAAAEDAKRAGAAVSIEIEPGLEASLRRNAVKRALSNLATNAAHHAKTVKVSAIRDASGLILAVDDDGPGIPEALYEEAFRPFSRLDASRNQNKQGVGLGLAIARDLARSHGGDVVLAKSAMGGLRAELRLPG
jgi:two-component system, OmpR family, osmolarity sensor histidine kinase EnvZ